MANVSLGMQFVGPMFFLAGAEKYLVNRRKGRKKKEGVLKEKI